MKNFVRNGCLLVILGLMCATNLRAQTNTLNFTDARGQKQGRWVEYVAIDGAKYKTIGYYKDNRKDSVCNIYHFNGNLMCRAYFNEGKSEGVEHNFFEDGTIFNVFVWKDGNDIWKMRFDGKGRPLSEQTEEDYGRFFYENGKWKVPAVPLDTVAGNFTDANGRKQGKWFTTYIDEGEKHKVIGYYKDGIVDSVWNSYHSNGNLSCSFRYKDGKSDGVWHDFREDGTIFRVNVWKDGNFLWMMQFTKQGYPHYDESIVTKEQNYYKDGKWLVPNIPPK